MAILRKTEHKVTVQGTMINFPNANCRLTVKKQINIHGIFPAEIHFCYQTSPQTLLITAQVHAA